MKDIALNIWTKYQGWPTWGKVLGVVVLVAIPALWLAARFLGSNTETGQLTELDDFEQKRTDKKMAALAQNESRIARNIETKKREVRHALDKAEEADTLTIEKKDAVLKATTMEELDELQKKWNL